MSNSNNSKVNWFLSTFKKVILWGPTFFEACSVAMISTAVNILTTLGMTEPNSTTTPLLRKLLYFVAMLSAVGNFAASIKMWRMVREAFAKHVVSDYAWNELIKQYECDDSPEQPEQKHNDRKVSKTFKWWAASAFAFVIVIVWLIVN